MVSTQPRSHTTALIVLALALSTISTMSMGGCGFADRPGGRDDNATLLDDSITTTPPSRDDDESKHSVGSLSESPDEADETPVVSPLTPEARAEREADLAQIIAERKEVLLDRYLDDPFPSPDSANDSERCWGRAGFALAAYHQGRELARADQYLREIHGEFAFEQDGAADASACYFAMPLLIRIYFDAETQPHLTTETRAQLLHLMDQFVFARSQIEVAQDTTWRVVMSENHDVIQKSAYLLATRALMEAGAPYGPERTMADGHTTQAHYESWLDYWSRHLRARAREGIACEIASPVYAKHSLASYLGVLDFSGDPALRSTAQSFLTLYWADVAQDFLKEVGVRGGAETRTYKNAYLTQGGRQSTRPWSYLYGWHDNENPSTHPLTLVAAASSFAPSAIVHAQATDKANPYLYTSRRCGRGGMTRQNGEPLYRIGFDNGRGSHLLRTSFVTEDYVVGALSFAPEEPFNNLVGQNRTMGIRFASDVDDRIVVHGRGLDKDGTVGYSEITGVVAEDVLVVGRDPEFRRSSGVRIFISDGDLWDNRVEYANWFFTRTDDAYVGIRMSDAGYKVKNDPDGKMLDQVDDWTPIVLQTGQSSNYPSFEAFQAAVASNVYQVKRSAAGVTRRTLTSDGHSLVHSRVTYRSEAGQVLKVYSHNRKLPKIDDRSIDLLPKQTYASPTLDSTYGSSTVELRHPLFGSLTLDFSTGS